MKARDYITPELPERIREKDIEVLQEDTCCPTCGSWTSILINEDLAFRQSSCPLCITRKEEEVWHEPIRQA